MEESRPLTCDDLLMEDLECSNEVDYTYDAIGEHVNYIIDTDIEEELTRRTNSIFEASESDTPSSILNEFEDELQRIIDNSGNELVFALTNDEFYPNYDRAVPSNISCNDNTVAATISCDDIASNCFDTKKYDWADSEIEDEPLYDDTVYNAGYDFLYSDDQ